MHFASLSPRDSGRNNAQFMLENMTGLACSHTGNLGLQMHIQWIAHVPGHIPGLTLSPVLHILLIDRKLFWTSHHPTWIAAGSQFLCWCPWFWSAALVFNRNFQKLGISGTDISVRMRLWNAAGGFGLRYELVFSVLQSRNLNSWFPIHFPTLLLSPGEHVTSRFKNEVERMGFDMNNAWRISNINEKYKWVLGLLLHSQTAAQNTPLLKLLSTSTVHKKKQSE